MGRGRGYSNEQRGKSDRTCQHADVLLDPVTRQPYKKHCTRLLAKATQGDYCIRHVQREPTRHRSATPQAPTTPDERHAKRYEGSA